MSINYIIKQIKTELIKDKELMKNVNFINIHGPYKKVVKISIDKDNKKIIEEIDNGIR